jgi:hypothetical protein
LRAAFILLRANPSIFVNNSPGPLLCYREYRHFPSVEAATSYFDSQRGQYGPNVTTKYVYGSIGYGSITEKAPTIYKKVEKEGGLKIMEQYDSLVLKKESSVSYT